jgi:uncharacterized protein (DUF427 family)
VCEVTARHLRIVHRGVVVAETRRGVRTLETSHPPSYYFPPEDVAAGVLVAAGGGSFCEWKGSARYFDVAVGGEVLRKVAWAYPAPSPSFVALRDYVAFYAGPFEGCFVDGELVTPQAGGFYGGWITSHVVGPFKGPPGTMMW